jgi:hypothetical protein
MIPPVLDEPQTTLLDLTAKEINAYWVDPSQPLVVPNKPLHWYAHELQLLLSILKIQAQRNPAQFNSKNYIDTLSAYTKAVEAINEGKSANDLLDAGEVAGKRDTGTTPANSNIKPISMDS